MAAMVEPRMPTSALKLSDAVATVPPRITRSKGCIASLHSERPLRIAGMHTRPQSAFGLVPDIHAFNVGAMPLLDTSANGVYIIAARPFTDDGAVDTASVDRLMDFYVACGIT